jgi:DNA-binding MarR family transcriptional regulator
MNRPSRPAPAAATVPERRVRGALMLNLTYAARLSDALLYEELRAEGVRPEFAGLLTEIRVGEPITPTALAQRTALAPATLYDYVEEMAADGLVERVSNPRDGRSYFLQTTDAGKERVAGVASGVRRAHARFLEELDLPLENVEDAVAALRLALERTLNRGATK